MRKSEIFESFIKMAKEKGLISDDESSTNTKHTEKNTPNPRWDSLSIEQIGKLYGVKPDAPADMEYKKNIIEDAHPDAVVTAPSYDKLNGLVENENEGQNIRARITMKIPDGQLTQKKYAEKQLTLSLVRIANDLDNKNMDELRKLADVCILQTTKPQIVKTALFPLLIGIAAAALGAIYFKTHSKLHSEGFNLDYKEAMNQIDDLLKSTANVTGYSYRPEFIQTVTDLKDKLQQFYSEYQSLTPVLDKMDTPKTGKELLELSQSPESKDSIEQVQRFRKQALNLYPFIRKIIQNFSDEEYKKRQIIDKGFLTKFVDSIPGLHGGSAFVPDDFDDVARILQTLLNDISNIMKVVQTSSSVEQSAKQELQQASTESEKMLSEKQEQAPTSPVKTKEEAPWSDLEKELSGGL